MLLAVLNTSSVIPFFQGAKSSSITLLTIKQNKLISSCRAHALTATFKYTGINVYHTVVMNLSFDSLHNWQTKFISFYLIFLTTYNTYLTKNNFYPYGSTSAYHYLRGQHLLGKSLRVLCEPRVSNSYAVFVFN